MSTTQFTLVCIDFLYFLFKFQVPSIPRNSSIDDGIAGFFNILHASLKAFLEFPYFTWNATHLDIKAMHHPNAT